MQNWGGLLACRFLIGVFEAGFLPGTLHECYEQQASNDNSGCVYLISMYYKRYELQWRLNLFFSASILAGAISGVRTLIKKTLITIAE